MENTQIVWISKKRRFMSHSIARVQGHIATGSLLLEEPVHASWSRFCIVKHQALRGNYRLSNMKCPGGDSNQRPQRLKASSQTATPSSPKVLYRGKNIQSFGLKFSANLDQGKLIVEPILDINK